MTDLHAKIGAALDREQAQHTRDAILTGDECCCECSLTGGYKWVAWPCLPMRRVEADRSVLARHAYKFNLCDWCELNIFLCGPCPDLLDLAARYET